MAKESVVYSTGDKIGASSRPEASPKTEMIVQGDGSSSKGSLGPLEPRLYVVRGGMRYPVTDPRSFRAAGYDPSAVKVISDAELQKIPVAQKLAPGEQIVLDLDSFLGSGHYMTTWGV